MIKRKQNAAKKKQKLRACIKKLNTFRHQFEEIVQNSESSSLKTPFSLLVIASYLNHLDFKGSINHLLCLDPSQWKYCPGLLSQLLVLATFIIASKKIALRGISQTFSGMDLELLIGEPVDPAELSDESKRNEYYSH